MFVHGFSGCTALTNLVDADFVVPGGDAEDFGGGGEGEVGDGVFGTLGDLEVGGYLDCCGLSLAGC